MASLAQLVVRPANTMRVVMGTQPPLVVIWPSKGAVQRNWGDKLNPWLVSRLSGRNVLNAATVFKQAVPIVHAVVGSHVGRITRPNVNIFGTGFMRHADRLRIEPRPARLSQAGRCRRGRHRKDRNPSKQGRG